MSRIVVFRGIARASDNPEFIDHCIGILNPAHWKGTEPTVHIYPSPFHATFAWRGEVFAYAFPSGKRDRILLGLTGQEEACSPYPCPGGTYSGAVSALAQLLNVFLAQESESSEQRLRWVARDKEEIQKILAKA